MKTVENICLATLCIVFVEGWSIRTPGDNSAHGDSTVLKICQKVLPECSGPSCIERVHCVHGFCNEYGKCECLPCFSGKSCQYYEDKYGPRFAIPEDTVIISAKHTGVVYKATAEDEDLGLTCPLGPGLNTRCPCASISYSLTGNNYTQEIFNIHESSGQLTLKSGIALTSGDHYHLHIVASNMNASQSTPVRLLSASQTLSIVIHSNDMLTDLLKMHQRMDSENKGT